VYLILVTTPCIGFPNPQLAKILFLIICFSDLFHKVEVLSSLWPFILLLSMECRMTFAFLVNLFFFLPVLQLVAATHDPEMTSEGGGTTSL
jgi:hypothetical protein